MVGKDKVFAVEPGSPMSDAAQLMLHNDVSHTFRLYCVTCLQTADQKHGIM